MAMTFVLLFDRFEGRNESTGVTAEGLIVAFNVDIGVQEK